MLSFIMPSVVILTGITLRVILLSLILSSVVAPTQMLTRDKRSSLFRPRIDSEKQFEESVKEQLNFFLMTL
jgi:hypothetical protein